MPTKKQLNETPPPSIDESIDDFFGGDVDIELDLSRGRIKKDVEEKTKEKIKRESKPKKREKSQQELERESLEKQARFLDQFQKKIEKRKQAELEHEIEIAKRQEDRRKIKEKKKKRNLPAGVVTRYGHVDSEKCEHEYGLDYVNDNKISSSCKHCSVEKIWSMKDWVAYNNSRKPKHKLLRNPDPKTFQF